MGMVKDKVVHGLFDQRSELLSNQQRAEAEIQALERRLEQIHARCKSGSRRMRSASPNCSESGPPRGNKTSS